MTNLSVGVSPYPSTDTVLKHARAAHGRPRYTVDGAGRTQDDYVQELHLRLVEAVTRSDLSHVDDLPLYALKAMHNRARDLGRASGRRGEREELRGAPGDYEHLATGLTAEAVEGHCCARRLERRLSSDHARALWRVDVLGQTKTDAAEAEGVTRRVFDRRYRNARAHAVAIIGENDG